MDPITGIIAAAGIGMQLAGIGGGLFSGMGMAGIAKQQAQLSMQNTALEGEQNFFRRLAMQISSRRQSMETTRRTQLAQSQSLAAATNQGAQFSSGLAGGEATVTSAGALQQQTTNQQLGIGNQLFDIQGQITQNQMALAGLGGQMANLQGQADIFKGIGALGGSLTGSAGPMGNILGNFFGNSQSPDALAAGQGFGYSTTNNYMNPEGRAIGGV
jgi:hypothetical protein